MRIDAHQHYWRVERGDYGWLTPERGSIYRDFLPADLHPHLQAGGIERTILVQAAPTQAETNYLLSLARAEATVAGVVGWVDFNAADARARVRRAAGEPVLVGLRPMIHDIDDDRWMLRPHLAAAFEAMAEEGLVLDALVRPRHLPHLRRLADQHPDLTIVLDHCGKPAIASGGMDPWADDLAQLALRANVRCKLSGLPTEAGDGWRVAQLAPYADHAVACFGSERVMWGSDWPVVEAAGGYSRWFHAAQALISSRGPQERAAIMGGTAAATYLASRGRP